MRRWVCPLCDEGKLAPERARRDDTRTYCLACSERTGRLVRRTCIVKAARDVEREQREQRAREERAQLAAQRRVERASVRQRNREAALRAQEDTVHSLVNREPHELSGLPEQLRSASVAKTLAHLFAWWSSFTPERREAYRQQLVRLGAAAPRLFNLHALEHLDSLVRSTYEPITNAPTYPLSTIVDAAARARFDVERARDVLIRTLRADHHRPRLHPIADEIEAR